jgi:hypothetical protein
VGAALFELVTLHALFGHDPLRSLQYAREGCGKGKVAKVYELAEAADAASLRADEAAAGGKLDMNFMHASSPLMAVVRDCSLMCGLLIALARIASDDSEAAATAGSQRKAGVQPSLSVAQSGDLRPRAVRVAVGVAVLFVMWRTCLGLHSATTPDAESFARWSIGNVSLHPSVLFSFLVNFLCFASYTLMSVYGLPHLLSTFALMSRPTLKNPPRSNSNLAQFCSSAPTTQLKPRVSE